MQLNTTIERIVLCISSPWSGNQEKGKGPCRGPGSTASARRKQRERCEAAQNNKIMPKPRRSEEHTSELQSLTNLVCRLLLEKKKKKKKKTQNKTKQKKPSVQKTK